MLKLTVAAHLSLAVVHILSTWQQNGLEADATQCGGRVGDFVGLTQSRREQRSRRSNRKENHTCQHLGPNKVDTTALTDSQAQGRAQTACLHTYIVVFEYMNCVLRH